MNENLFNLTTKRILMIIIKGKNKELYFDFFYFITQNIRLVYKN